MKFFHFLSYAFLILIQCAVKNYNLNWQVDLPHEDVKFVFLPSNLDLSQNILSTTNSVLEVYYDRKNKGKTYHSEYWNYLDHFNNEYIKGVKIKIKIPNIKVAREIAIRKKETIPDSLLQGKFINRKLNYEKLSFYFSQFLSSRLKWLESIATEKNCNIIVVSDASFYIVEN